MYIHIKNNTFNTLYDNIDLSKSIKYDYILIIIVFYIAQLQISIRIDTFKKPSTKSTTQNRTNYQDQSPTHTHTHSQHPKPQHIQHMIDNDREHKRTNTQTTRNRDISGHARGQHSASELAARSIYGRLLFFDLMSRPEAEVVNWLLADHPTTLRGFEGANPAAINRA